MALSATAHRLRGNFAESRNVLDEAAPRFPNDPLLATERGVLLLAEGKGAEAAQVWLTLLRTHGLMLSTFVHATEWALRESDAGVASNLVDCVLEIPNAPVAFLRMALKLAESLEPKGLPRAARLADLCIRLLAQTPGDSIARLVLARAYGEQGENAKGLAELALVRESMKDTPMSAEADRLTFSLREPEVAATLDAILRAAEEADVGDLDLVAARAHKIAFEYEIWTAHYALGIAEKRKGRYATARRSFEAAIALSKGAVPAYVEAASVTLSLGEARAALPLAERATVLDPEHALAWAYLARARLALGERVLAREAIARATALAPGNETLSALESRVLRANESTFFSKVRALFQRG